MTVAELIAALQDEDPHARVVVAGAELRGRLDGSPSTVDLFPDFRLTCACDWVCTCGALAIAEGACSCG